MRGHESWARKVLQCSVTRLRSLREEIAHGLSARVSWTATLLAYRDAAWMAERRAAEGPDSVAAGRVGVRIASGRTAPRFEETVLRAAMSS